MISELKSQVDTLSRLYNILKSTKSTNNHDKLISNSKSINKILIKKFKGIDKISPTLPKNVNQGKDVLKRFTKTMNVQYNTNIKENELLSIFKQTYSFMTKTLILINTSMVAVGAIAISTQGWMILIVPFAIVATLSIFINAKSHGISYEQSILNFKKSFSELMERHKFTSKEKSFAYFPYLIITVSIFLLQTTWASWSISHILKLTTTHSIDSTFTSGEYSAKEIFKSMDLSGKESILDKITIGHFIFVFAIALIIYLLLSLLDQMILRKGETDSEV